MNRAELARRRRCRLLQIAIFFGVLLPVFAPSRVTIAAAVIGIAVVILTYRRECRGLGASSTPRR